MSEPREVEDEVPKPTPPAITSSQDDTAMTTSPVSSHAQPTTDAAPTTSPTRDAEAHETTTAANTRTLSAPTTEAPNTEPQLSENTRTLKEAFPDVDVEVIDAILESQGGRLEPSFEALLTMSDPNYKPDTTPPPAQQTHPAPTTGDENDPNVPPMPPRPHNQTTSNDSSYAYWQQQQPTQPGQTQTISVEEQMRMDEEYAKQLALEDEQARVQRHRQRQQPAQPTQEEPLFNFQEELPIIKERVIEAGNAAKKKVMDLYNQFKQSRANSSGSSIPTTNAQYRDEGDDLLTGDMSALRLSDHDVYAQTGGRPRRWSEDHYRREGQTDADDNVIHVNPPYPPPRQAPITQQQQQQQQPVTKTSTNEEQLRADEEYARQVANEWAAAEAAENDQPAGTPPIGRTNSFNRTGHPMIVSPRSPLEYNGGFDEDEPALTRRTEPLSKTSSPPAPKESTANSGRKTETTTATETRPYVIGDDEDSEDDLVDVDDDDDVDTGKDANDKKESAGPESQRTESIDKPHAKSSTKE
ncbi:uncharacterized protein BYT42DRAFT_617512 [Radiomyces spectabilis]|uniref:uncharacterized protein n=1 Tax=Radiomyces spectabilis TaxID=64574 RepID=UPI00221FEAD2|nr:uncharacterized protein BYT42DRAFT_617512 [Radiomyces spectabilis]KAI8369498.1 hypothetical protein BYT42DRAFT_617512 [Radiomyces spectabilis]